MYIPTSFEWNDRTQIAAFMRENSFALLCSQPSTGGVPLLTHTPALLEERADGTWYLLTHLARQNPQAQHLEASAGTDAGEVTVVFSGPHAYISPSLYGKVLNVPTWNYLAIHATGEVRVVREKEAVLAFFETMFAAYDPAYAEQFHALPEGYTHGLLEALTAIEIRITRLEAKCKLNQNKPADDRTRIAASLAQSPRTEIRETGEWMTRIVL